MMIDKSMFNQNISILKDLVKKYSLDDTFGDDLCKLESKAERFAVKTLLVGRFSAGKSALINSLLERDILKENQLPETALATEIVYSQEEKCELISSDGNSTKCSFTEAERFCPDNFNHAIYYINSDFLMRQSDFIFVDMPGFDSSIERHNKAILQYVRQACAYILIVDCEDGDLSQPTIQFLHEIRQYHSNLAIIITKSEKKTKDAIVEIEKQIKDTASSMFGEEIAVCSVSAFDGQLCEKVSRLLETIDTEKVFYEKFSMELNEICKMLHISLKSIRKSSYYSSEDIDMQIEQTERERCYIEEQLKTEQKKLHGKIFNIAYPDVMLDLKNALLSNSTTLTNSALAGTESFQRCVNDIIRPVLITSVNSNINASFQSFISEVDFRIEESPDGGEVTQHIRDLFSSFQNAAGMIYEKSQGINKDKNDKARAASKGIFTILAVTTDIVAPWLELILIFLPDIMNIIGMLAKKNQIETLNSRMKNEIIPQILTRLEPEVKQSFMEMENQLINELIQKSSVLIDAKKESLIKLTEKVKKDRADFDRLISGLHDDMETIKELMLKLGGMAIAGGKG